MALPHMSPFFALATLFAVPLGAQGNVLTVDDGPIDYGGAWLVDLNADGTLDSQALLPLPEAVSDQDGFGSAVAPLGDLDGDGAQDVAVGAPGEDVAALGSGAVWLLFRAPDESIDRRIPLRLGRNFAAGTVVGGEGFGQALAPLGDLDGDGTLELAVGAPTTPLAGWTPPRPGSVWILSLDADGNVARATEISQSNGGFAGALDPGDGFGCSLAALGDLDGDARVELAIGARGDDDGGTDRGAVWIVSLEADGTVGAEQKISATAGGFSGALSFDCRFGSSLAALGDLDGDGVSELAVGTPRDDDGSGDSGAVWILFLAPAGTVLSEQKISKTQGGLGSHSDILFGTSAAGIGDRDSDGVPDLAVGARGVAGGAVFVLFLDAAGTVVAPERHGVAAFGGATTSDGLGASLAALGDWDLDGRPDLAVGAPTRDGAPTSPDFTSVASAVAAASSGDTILVRGGIYTAGGAVVVQAKSLTLQAVNPQNVRLSAGLRVADLTAAQSVRLSGLFVFDDAGTLVLVEDCDGTVWIDDCTLGSLFLWEQLPLEVTNSSAVILNRSRLYASPSGSGPAPVPAALELGGGSHFFAYDSVFEGADGPCQTTFQGGCHFPIGGAGIRTSSASDFLYLSGCTVQGGSSSVVAGGPGLETAGTAKVLDSELIGGTGMPDGAPTVGAVELLSGERLSMAVANPTRENEQTLFTFEGPRAARVFVLYSLALGARYRPALQGADLLGNLRVVDYAGQIGPDGRLVAIEHLGSLPPGAEVLRLHAQAYYELASSAEFAHKTSRYPRTLQLGSGVVLHRLPQGF